MAIEKMAESLHGNTRVYKHTLNQVSADGTTVGSSVVLPDKLLDLSVAVYPGALATAKVQLSVSPLQDVIDGVANWVDWAPGAVTSATLHHLGGPITAYRLSTSTTATVAEGTTIEATGNELI